MVTKVTPLFNEKTYHVTPHIHNDLANKWAKSLKKLRTSRDFKIEWYDHFIYRVPFRDVTRVYGCFTNKKLRRYSRKPSQSGVHITNYVGELCFVLFPTKLNDFIYNYGKPPKYFYYDIRWNTRNSMLEDKEAIKFLKIMAKYNMFEDDCDIEHVIKTKTALLTDFTKYSKQKLYAILSNYRTLRQHKKLVLWINWCHDNFNMHPAVAMAAGIKYKHMSFGNHYLSDIRLLKQSPTILKNICLGACRIIKPLSDNKLYSIENNKFALGSYNCFKTMLSYNIQDHLKLFTADNYFNFNPQEYIEYIG